MRIRLVTLFFILGLCGTAAAVPTDPGGTVSFVVEQRAPGSLQWDAYLFSAPGAEVAGVSALLTGFVAWEWAESLPNLSYPDSFYYHDAINGFSYLALVSLPDTLLGGTDDLDALLLGTLTSTEPILESVGFYASPSLPPVTIFGPLEFGQFFEYPQDETIAAIVPEPGTLVLASVAASLVARRLRPAQHRSR